MKLCRKCGCVTEDNTFYCPDCGEDLGKKLTEEEIHAYLAARDDKNRGNDVMEYDELARRMTGATIGRLADVFHRGEKNEH